MVNLLSWVLKKDLLLIKVTFPDTDQNTILLKAQKYLLLIALKILNFKKRKMCFGQELSE